MDLASLTRPAIQCQCLRCSSSLAVLENEWAKLSNSYSIATAWLSVNLHRISISSERKQIPQTSEMSLLRGRIIQELSCKLCQQKLGVLCTLDNGPNVLWKMSKVSFRDVVTMRTAEPIYQEGALERLCPTPNEPLRGERNDSDNALVPTGTSNTSSLSPFMQQQMQHQGRSIDQISNSVNHLHDTMNDLKHSFTALRIELNGPNRHVGEHSAVKGSDFDMIATVLKELKSKSEEIEKLKLEIETLKFKNRFMEERKPKTSESPLGVIGALPEVKSPDLLQAGRKRAWPDAFANSRPHVVADSFGEEDMVDDLSLEDLPTYSDRVPVQDQRLHLAETTRAKQPALETPQLRVEVFESRGESTPRDHEAPISHPEQSPAKRLRLNQIPGESSQPSIRPDKRKANGPKKSLGQSTDSNPSQNASATASNSEEINGSNPAIQVPVSTSSPPAQPARRSRTRRSTRSQSMGSSGLKDQTQSSFAEISTEKSSENVSRSTSSSQKTGSDSSKTGKSNGVDTYGAELQAAAEEKRKTKVAARDVMTRLAMQREEAMETDEGR